MDWDQRSMDNLRPNRKFIQSRLNIKNELIKTHTNDIGYLFNDYRN